MLDSKSNKFTILFISANYRETTVKTRTDKEFEIIKEIIEKSPLRDFISLQSAFAIERRDFTNRVSRYQPQMIHFAGHGESDAGFMFEDDMYTKDAYGSKYLLEDTLRVLKEYKDIIKITIFNCCESLEIAKSAMEFLPITIGTKKKVYDNDAITFSEVFYEVFCNNDKIGKAFRNAINLQNREIEEYRSFYMDPNMSEYNLENFLNYNLENTFLGKFDKYLKDILEWALIFTINLKQENISPFINSFFSFLDKFFQIEIKDSNKEEIINNINLEDLREIVPQITIALTSFYEENTIYKERIFDKIYQTLNILKTYHERNPSFFTLLCSRLLSNFKNLNLEGIDWETEINNTIENFNGPLWRLRAKNCNKIIDFEDDDLLNYCSQQLELVDLASRFESRFNPELFERDPELEKNFEEFFRNLRNFQGKNRIFLLLGYMGLGKTWNASYIASEFIKKKIPTLYFHLRSYEDRFEDILGGFDSELSKISKIIAFKEVKKRNILLIFDGFDELTQDERGPFLNNLCDLIELKNNYKHLIILLTSRLVDWVNTEKVIQNSRQYKRYIFQKFERFEDNDIPTGASYILSDITDLNRLKRINENYGIDFNKVKDKHAKKLLMKPFIIRLISETNVNIVEKDFDPFDDEWYNLFENIKAENTILTRMGIVGTVENDFKDIVSFIANPYTSILDNELIKFIKERKRSWDVIYSSGIIKLDKTQTQFKYFFQEEYQGFIERFSSKLKKKFQEFVICNSDANSLEEIEEQVGRNTLRNLSDFKERSRSQGYVIDKNDRVSELYLDRLKTKRIPRGVYKLIGLKILDLQNNQLPKLPKDISKLKKLEILNLEANELQELPNSLTELKMLNRLNITKNSIKTIDTWWHDFKNLEIVNLMNNTIILHIPDREVLPSIDYVDNNLLMIDDRIEYKGQVLNKTENQYLKIKETVVVDYLNHLKRLSNELSYWVSINNEYINSLIIKIPLKLLHKFQFKDYFVFKDILWSLEKLKSLELKGELIEFGKNSSIETLKIIDIKGKGHQIYLNLHKSISSLEKLKSIYIENFFRFKFPESLKSCSNLKELIIDSPISTNLPDIVFNWNLFPNILIIISSEDIKSYMIKDEINDSRVLVSLNPGFNLNQLNIPPHVEKLWIKIQTRFPENVSIKARLEKLIITNQENLSKELFQKLKYWKIPEKGIFLFGFSRGQTVLPNIISNFENLTHLRINFSFITSLKEWIFSSPHIKKMLISEEILPSPNEDFLLDKNQGVFLLRVRNDCKFPREEIHLKSLTNFRINLSNMMELPNFLGMLNQFNQILITSTDLDILSGSFGSEETRFRLELRVNSRCQMSGSINKLENLTHLFINNIALGGLPIAWKTLQNVSYIRLINSRITKIPELLSKLKKIKYLHISFKISQDFRENFWVNGSDNRLEIAIPHDIPLQYSYTQNITHLRISGSRTKRYFDLTESNFDHITHIRIDNSNTFPSFLKECKNLLYIEINTEHSDQIPRNFMHFKQIQQLVITDKPIECSDDFWNTKKICTFKIKVRPNCKFPNFLSELYNLTHLWIELPSLKQLPDDLKELQAKNFRLRIIGGEQPDQISIEDYLKIPNPNFFIIIVHPNCTIPDSIKD